MAGLYMPKADIWLKNFDINHEMQNSRNQAGRVPDYEFPRYRNLLWRVDEMATRQEKFIRDQGYFYLPTLDFPSYRGVPPIMSAYQLRLHYSRHHKTYIDKLNTLIVSTPFEGLPLDELIRKSANQAQFKAIYNNAAQHYNHCFFWKSLQPWGTNIPPDLLAAIEKQYASLDKFKEEFERAAVGLFGSGWVYFVYKPTEKAFEIIPYSNAGCPLSQDYIPLLTLDVWEHAYYVDYENDRGKFVKGFWEVCDWHWAERHWKRSTGQEYHEMSFS
jgi:Fe-Mn family superoxide dismutase